MKKLFILLVASAMVISISCDRSKVDYPETRKGDVVDNYFGVEVADPYRWFEDDKSEEVANWVEAQNAVTNAYFSEIPYREALKNRLAEIWNYNTMSAPFMEGGKMFFYKREGLQNQSVLYVQNSLEEEAKVLIDPNNLSEDGTVALGGISVSRNAKYVAYAVADGGSDWRKILVREIETGTDLTDEVRWVKFSSIEWFKDGFFYSRYDEPKNGSELSNINQFHKVYYHKLGTPQAEDELIFHSTIYPLRNYRAQVTSDEKYLIISESESTQGNSLYIKNLTKEHEFIQLTTSFEYNYYVLDQVNDHLYVLTN
jgi:prolyl oligopeptidase